MNQISNVAANFPASGIRAMFDLAAHYPGYMNLCNGEPNFETPDNIKKSACDAIWGGMTKYSPEPGLPAYRQAVADKYTKQFGVEYKPTNVCAALGGVEGVMLSLMTIMNPGDEIIVPSFRSDVEHKADIAEEIARFYGYNNIPTTIAKGSPEGGYNEYQKFERVVNQNMLAQGMYEIMTYSFVSPKQYDKIRLPKDDPKRQSVVIRNPLGEDTSIMRTNAIPSMMDILSKNYNNRNGAVSLYEIGNEYIPVEGELLPDEVPNLVLGMYGDDKDFFTLKGVVENLLDTLAIREYDVDAKSDDPTFHPGRCAVLSKDGEEFGIIGEVHPLVCANYGINTRVYVGKLKLRKLFAMMDTQRSYVPMPKFPASTRDLALLCDDALPVMTMEKAIKDELQYTDNVAAAAAVGTAVAKKALEKGITEVVFDRGGFIYQGKIQALAREAGLKF